MRLKTLRNTLDAITKFLVQGSRGLELELGLYG